MSINGDFELFSDLTETQQELVAGGFNANIGSYFNYLVESSIYQQPFYENTSAQDFSTNVVINNPVQINISLAIGENNTSTAASQQSITTLA